MVHSSSFKFYPELMEEYFGPVALGGFVFALTIVFYVKYLIIYGIPKAMAEIDCLTNVLPNQPECTAQMSKASSLWKKFDQGLYFFLLR